VGSLSNLAVWQASAVFSLLVVVECECLGLAPRFPYRAFKVGKEEERQHGKGTPASQPTCLGED